MRARLNNVLRRAITVLRSATATFRMIGGQLISALLQQATAQGSRSTVLRPLGWLATICAASLLGAIQLRAANWVVVTLAIFLGLTVGLYLISYAYCLLTDKEVLRSESYSIQKLAIEKGFVGDSLAGVFGTEQAITEIVAVPDPNAKGEEK